jgi:DNA polymerase
MAVVQNSLSALAWLIDAGADEAVGEAPVDRFAARSAAARAQPPLKEGSTGFSGSEPTSTPPRSSSKFAPESPAPPQGQGGDGIGDAIARARSANSLAELRAALEGFDGCALKRTATNTVFADGTPAHRIMFIGEAPGRDEDRQGLPFVGRAGKLLDKMLAAIHLDRTKVYITNVLNWRPPDNRDPSPEEAAMCLPFLRRHIDLVNPEIMILLGAVSVRHVMGRSDGIMKTRGRWLEYNVHGRMVPVMPTLHPAYLLRQPAHKKLAWRDLQAIEEKVASLRLLERETASG